MATNASISAIRPSNFAWRMSLAGLVILLHLAAVAFVVFDSGGSSGPYLLRLLKLGYVWADVSIAAIWTVYGRGSVFWRAPITGILLVGAWTLTMAALDQRLSDPNGPGWVVLLATQFILLLGSIWCAARFSEPRRLKFSLWHMLYVVTLVSVLFAALQSAAHALGWSDEVLSWEYFFYCPVLGFFNAAAAIMMLVALASYGVFRKVILGGAGLALAAFLGTLCYATLYIGFGKVGGLTISQLTILLVIQAASVWITVFPFWRWSHPTAS